MRDTLSTNGKHLQVAEVKSFPAIPKSMRSVNGDRNGANLKKKSVLLVCTIHLFITSAKTAVQTLIIMCRDGELFCRKTRCLWLTFLIYDFRWLGTVVTSHTASNRQAYTPVMSMLQKAVQSTHCRSHCTSCNQPAHTNVIMLYAFKCSLYVVGPFYAGHCIKIGLQGVKMWQNCLVCQNEPGDIWIFFFANPI